MPTADSVIDRSPGPSRRLNGDEDSRITVGPRRPLAAKPGLGAPVEPRSSQRPWSVNILLVEDDAADTSLILDVLKRHPKVSAAQASDHPELALTQIAAGRWEPNLVLLDIHMPRIDGFAFLERLRLIPAMASVPVVFLTTSCLARDAVKAQQGSAASYIIKPNTYAELQARLDTVIKRAVFG
ncbi:MAG: domain/GGDEF domain protein [Caulobacter sp.]|nr:domain/GGDEF domain protein [Caulobacter sp.]